LEYLRNLLLIKTGSADIVDLTSEDLAELKELAARADMTRILQSVKLFGKLDISLDNYSALPLELALVDCVLASGESEPEQRQPPQPEIRQQVKPAATVTGRVEPKVSQQVKTAVPASSPVQDGTPPPQPATIKETVPPLAPDNGSSESPPVFQPGTEIERLTANWREIIASAPADVKKTNAIALLRSGSQPVRIEGDVVILSFKHGMLKEKMEKQENLQAAEKILSSFLGRSCQVRCVHEPESNHLVQEAIRMGAQITSVEEK
jgi:DNA polymerase-3 subunit gamma/tau